MNGTVRDIIRIKPFVFLKKTDTLYCMGQEGFKRERQEEEGEKKKEEGEYNFEAIKELEKPLVLVLEKLKANIEAGLYDVLLSDDKGGRIPTLALREIMNKENEKAGRGSISTFFLSAGRGLSLTDDLQRAMKKYIEKKIKNKIERRALVVTEYVSSGMSIQVLADILKEAGVTAFDVAALVCNKEDIDLGEGQKFFSGITPHNAKENGWRVDESHPKELFTPSVYNRSELSGVVKKENTPYPQLHERLKKPSRRQRDQGTVNRKRKAREEVNKAREDVKTLAENAEKALGW